MDSLAVECLQRCCLAAVVGVPQSAVLQCGPFGSQVAGVSSDAFGSSIGPAAALVHVAAAHGLALLVAWYLPFHFIVSCALVAQLQSGLPTNV
jgi:hypothetical protein